MHKWLALSVAAVLSAGALAEDEWYYDPSGRTVVTPASEKAGYLDAGSAFDTYACTVRASEPDPTDVFDSVWYCLMPSLGLDRFSSERLGLLLFVR